MPHTFSIDIRKNLLREIYVGDINSKILEEANRTILSHPNYHPNLNFLTDLRQGNVILDYHEMSRHVKTLPDLKVNKQAFLVSSQLNYGMARMFNILVEDVHYLVDSKVFETLEEAEAWLNS